MNAFGYLTILLLVVYLFFKGIQEGILIKVLIRQRTEKEGRHLEIHNSLLVLHSCHKRVCVKF